MLLPSLPSPLGAASSCHLFAAQTVNFKFVPVYPVPFNLTPNPIANEIHERMQLSDTDKYTIEKIRQIIECGIFQPMAIKQLCEIAGMCKSKLMQGFYLLNNSTIYRYRLTIAMEYAKSLLEQGRSVKEVSILLGYKTPGHFSRAFTKVFPDSPGTFKSERNA